MTQTIENKALSRIYGSGRGWSFSPKDFADLGSRAAIDLALHRLNNKSTIRRVIRGIYDYPRYSELLLQEMEWSAIIEAMEQLEYEINELPR